MFYDGFTKCLSMVGVNDRQVVVSNILHFLCSPLIGEMIQFDAYMFQIG